MRITAILAEFLDYRAYVSHTLCKHRLFLGLSSAEHARLRLSDAAVWPLVCDEGAQLSRLSGTLFGIVSKPLETVAREIQSLCDAMRVQQRLLEEGNDAAFGAFKTHAERFSDGLSSIYAVLDEQTPDFSGEAVVKYLGGKSSQECLISANQEVVSHVVPLIETLLRNDGTPFRIPGKCCPSFIGELLSAYGDPNELYRRFWPESSAAYLVTRTYIVAGAVEDLPAQAMAPVRELQRMVRSIERIVSCWAPNVRSEDRLGLVEKTLRAEGYDSGFALLERLMSLCGSKQ